MTEQEKDELIEALNKKYKRDDLIVTGRIAAQEFPRFGYTTGSPSLDRALGDIGGVPGGRVTEVWGPPGSGKTTLSLETIAHLHDKEPDARAAYLDLENAIDFEWAERIGVDLDRMYMSWPETGEEAFGVAEALIRSGGVHIVVVDSVPSISPRAEMEGEVGDAHVGLNPRLISQFLRKNAFAIRKSQVAVIFINQVRQKISRFASGLTQPGGFGLMHHKSVCIFLRNSGPVKLGDTPVGDKIEYTVQKNKVADPESVTRTVGSFEIWSDRGICLEADLIAEALAAEVLVKNGSWIAFKDGDNVAQGLARTVQCLTDNPEVLAEIQGRLDNGN
jgi:recombination protein RecA